jgi:hypothetical protein
MLSFPFHEKGVEKLNTFQPIAGGTTFAEV